MTVDNPDLMTLNNDIFSKPMVTAAAIDRVVHHFVILEFDLPSYPTDSALQRGQAEDVNRQK